MAKARVLIVEDEVLVAMQLKMNLVRLGYEVCGQTGRGDLAVRMAGERRPDAVLMDINLIGETDGIEAARLIGPAAAVIFTTGYTEAETRRRAMELEPLGYLIKPVDIAEVDRLLGSLAT